MKTGLAARLDRDEQKGGHQYIRPRDASTLLILDRSGQDIRVLMGRRHMRHTFMPGKFVFPGGRVDASDSRVKQSSDYHPTVKEKLSEQLKHNKTQARVRALALAAIRETYEEAGVFIGKKLPDTSSALKLGKGFEAFEERRIVPDLSSMRLIARAITPPGRPRRFDARFLAVWSDTIADRLESGVGPSGELEDIAWLTLDEAGKMDELPMITRTVITDLKERLKQDPELSPATEAPFYSFLRGDFQRSFL